MTNFWGSVKDEKDYPDYRIAIIGVPFDEKSGYLKGQAQGPAAVRAVSSGKCYNPFTESGVNLKEETVIVDLGDVDVSGSAEETFQRIERNISDVLKKGAVPFVVGGDHSITYPAVRAFAGFFGSLDILHFDAHPDLYEQLGGDRYSHACPFARIMEEGLAERLVQVGIRTATEEQRVIALKHGVHMIEMKDITEGLELGFKNPLYISFDLDALDPAFAPGVSHHEPGGLTTRQAIRIIQEARAKVVGLDVVELNPGRDMSGITAAAAAKIMKEVAGKIVRQAPDKSQ
jgi:agmatinase